MSTDTNATTVVFANGWVSQPNGRGTIDIIWSCFFTIFVSTYTSLHLNLPTPNESPVKVFLRKAKWMTAAVLVPEVVTAAAFAQYIAARNSVIQMKEMGCKEWTMRHAYFLNMGGVWLQPRDSKAFPINAIQLHRLVQEGVIEMPRLNAAEIWDKSKADRFAKIFSCFQIGWLVLQCLGRAVQKLPITPLEVATVGFAIPSLATFVLWFQKPMDVEVPTIVSASESTAEILKRISPLVHTWRQTPLDFIDTINSPSFTSEIILKTSHWPLRTNYLGPSARIRNDVFALKYTVLNQVCVALVWVGYAAVHLSAWTFDFPSLTEQLLWRIACLTMAGSMVVFWITSNRRFYQLVAYIIPSRKAELEKVVLERKKVSTVQILLGASTFLAYLSARLCLVVQVFLCLRKTPLGAFDTVNWINFLPHI